MKTFIASVAILMMASGAMAASVADFTDLTLPGAETHWNGSDGSGGFTSGGARFENSFDSVYGFWAGWAFSNVTDTTTADYTNQYSAVTGGGSTGSIYAVAWYDSYTPVTPRITLDRPMQLAGLEITNTTYAYMSMLNGDHFSPKIGGKDGTTPDWFKVTITGYDEAGVAKGSVDFWLADYRFEDSAQDYIVSDWRYCDLSTLGVVKSLDFLVSGSNGGWPTYIAVGEVVPEPVTLGFLALGGLALLKRRKA